MESTHVFNEANYPTTITVLGAGCEVGRSCVFVERGTSCIMFDCGLHPALSGVGALPVFEAVDISKVNVCLVTHFHLDHCGAIPYLLSKTAFKGRILMTYATKAICHLLWSDYARMEQLQSVKKIFDYSDKTEDDIIDELVCGSGLYTFEDVEYALNKIETIDFHEESMIDNIKISCFRAGHVLGACMFLVEVDGVRILYTGDYSTENDRHLPSAEIPFVNVHLLISESTYGIRIHEERKQRESRFLHVVLDIIMRNGKCLLPVFALGRAQEILLILDEYWSTNKQLQNVPIFYISPLAAKSLRVYETFVGLCGEYIKEGVYNGHNPFNFKFVKYARSVESVRAYLLRDGPCILMTSPGMLQGGPSLEVFELIAPDNRNGVILTGYTVKGTLADELKKDPEVLNLGNRVIKRRCTVDQISFSAHADYHQTKDFIKRLSVPNIILVHGERSEMKRMKNKLSEDIPELSVFMPEVLQAITLNFNQNRIIDTIGTLAKDLNYLFIDSKEKSTISVGDITSNVVIYDDNIPKMMYVNDIKNHSSLETYTLSQKMVILFPFGLDKLKVMIDEVYDDVIQINTNHLLISNMVNCIVMNGELKLYWTSNPVADLIADSINLMAIELLSKDVEDENLNGKLTEDTEEIFIKIAKLHLIQKFGKPHEIKKEEIEADLKEVKGYEGGKKSDEIMYFTVNDPSLDGKIINLKIDLINKKVTCQDDDTREIAIGIIKNVYDSLTPITI